jgi:preprotein translocase subunit SecG
LPTPYNKSFHSGISCRSFRKEKAVPLSALLLADAPWFFAPLNVLILLTGVFLMLLVLIQRGKGGGLAGALGGAGGSSAFGTRAGDQFTRITVYVALFWIFLIMFTIKMAGAATSVAPNRPSEGSGSQLYHHPSGHASEQKPANA